MNIIPDKSISKLVLVKLIDEERSIDSEIIEEVLVFEEVASSFLGEQNFNRYLVGKDTVVIPCGGPLLLNIKGGLLNAQQFALIGVSIAATFVNENFTTIPKGNNV